MPIRAIPDPSKKLIWFELAGKFTSHDFAACYDALLAHPAFQYNMDAIFDLRQGIATSLFTEELVQAVRHIEKRKKRRGAGYKVAFISHHDLFYEIKKMYEVYGFTMPFSIEVFCRIKDARKWLGTSAGPGMSSSR